MLVIGIIKSASANDDDDENDDDIKVNSFRRVNQMSFILIIQKHKYEILPHTPPFCQMTSPSFSLNKNTHVINFNNIYTLNSTYMVNTNQVMTYLQNESKCKL